MLFNKYSYYCSTIINLLERLKRYQKDDYKYIRKEKPNFISSFIILDSKKRYEIETRETIIEDDPEKVKHEMGERESYYNKCINKNNPHRTDEQKKQQKNRIQRKYYHQKKKKKKMKKKSNVNSQMNGYIVVNE